MLGIEKVFETSRYVIRKGYRTIMVVGLAVTLALSANVALAAHQLVEEESGVLKLRPTQVAGDATGQVDYEIVEEKDGSLNKVALAAKVRIEGLEDPENVEVFVIDEEANRTVNLGHLNEDSELEGKVAVPADLLKRLKAFDSVEILRSSRKDDKGRVLFTAELPHR